jgi:sn-glycerol 3-phosphate transport system permease protein
LLLPSGVFLLAFTYWPVLRAVLDSLTERAFGGATHWGFGNYARLFADAHFATAVRNNLVYAVGTIFPSLTSPCCSTWPCEKARASPASCAP